MSAGETFEVDTRRDIYEALQASPGAHFSELQRDLDLATGTLQYHLRVLEDRDLIEIKKDGRYTRYFPSFEVDRRDKDALGLLRQETPRRIVLDLLEHETSQLTEISDRLDLAPSTISFHMDKLMEADVARRPERGRYELVDEARLMDLLTTYQESFADRAVDRIVSLISGLSRDPADEDGDEDADA